MTLDATASYLEPSTLAAIASLEMRARMIVEGVTTGMHQSPYHGFSVEFAQHRQYAPGDDIRHLDWKVYGRTDKLYLKQYQQETNLDLILLVDASGSMAYGSVHTQTNPWRKYDHAAALAAAMAFLALRQRDRTGLILFDEAVRASTRVSGSHGHWQSIVDELSSQPPTRTPAASPATGDTPRTSIMRLFEQVLAKLSQRSLIVLISDLFDDPDAIERAMAQAYHWRHDLLVLQVLDPTERTFTFRSPTEFYGLEGDGRIKLDPSALRKGYLEALQRHLQRIEQITRQFGFDYALLDSSQSLGPPLSHFLARRASAVRRRT